MHLTRYKTGRYPIKLRIDNKILTLYSINISQDSVIYQDLLKDKNNRESYSNTSYIENRKLMNLRHVQENNRSLENCNKKKNKSNPLFSEYNKNKSLSQLLVNPKAGLYLQYKTEPRHEPYLDIITNRKIRVQYTKFTNRLSDHKLEIEKRSPNEVLKMKKKVAT